MRQLAGRRDSRPEPLQVEGLYRPVQAFQREFARRFELRKPFHGGMNPYVD
jgi:hypothetical protein